MAIVRKIIKTLFHSGILLTILSVIPAFGEDDDYLLMGSNTARRVWIRSSSNLHYDYRPIMALDSDRGSSWISAPSRGPHWISVDFETKRLMTSIVVYPGKCNGRWTFSRFVLQLYRNDDWFDFKTVSAQSRFSFRNRIEVDLGGIDARIFRIFIPPDAMTAESAAIAEIEIYTGSSKVTFFDERLSGLCLPIMNAYLPSEPSGYPNAPRAYRGGRHAGIDFFFFHREGSYDPIPVDETTPILAAANGVVIRADHHYIAPTIEEWQRRAATARTKSLTFMEQSFGGREIWIDHGRGVITVYNHLSRIAPAIVRGSKVSRGQIIGWAGNSGLAGEAKGTKDGIHLHFEIWIDGNYLGYGMPLPDIKKYLTWIFFKKQ